MKYSRHLFGAFIWSAGAMGAALVTALLPKAAQASFTCGPYMETYLVRSLDGRTGDGVRCVLFSEGIDSGGRVPVMAWYGEGVWGSSSYRHLGHAFGTLSAATGYASDFFGNGENFNNNFPGNLKITTSGAGVPSLISVTGAWNEIWRRLSGRVHSSYKSTLGRLRHCGNYMTHYRASDLLGARSGSGLRCILKAQPRVAATAGLATWFGKGNWGGSTYAHLGTWSYNGNGAADICEGSMFTFCNQFGWGSLHLQPVGTGYEMTGAWSESWN